MGIAGCILVVQVGVGEGAEGREGVIKWMRVAQLPVVDISQAGLRLQHPLTYRIQRKVEAPPSTKRAGSRNGTRRQSKWPNGHVILRCWQCCGSDHSELGKAQEWCELYHCVDKTVDSAAKGIFYRARRIPRTRDDSAIRLVEAIINVRVLTSIIRVWSISERLLWVYSRQWEGSAEEGEYGGDIGVTSSGQLSSSNAIKPWRLDLKMIAYV
jgi:hypothetical protein